VAWNAPNTLGSHLVSIVASDSLGASAVQNFMVTVVPDHTPPQPVLRSPQQVNLAQPFTISLQLDDDVDPATVQLTANGQPLALAADLTARFTPALLGSLSLAVTAADRAGNIGTASAQVLVIDPTNTAAPVLGIDPLTSSGNVNVPTQV